jgi:hypothetical protein
MNGMTHPRNAFGVSPSRGRQQQPGKAGSALALARGYEI